MMTEEETTACDVIMTAVKEDFNERIMSRQEQEENLTITDWYSMCVTLQQQELRLSGSDRPPGQAQSFLAQQRQSTQARSRRGMGLSPKLQPR
ncbi:protein Hook homolog 2-like [Salmo trutta]|uniref:protein Hook homolog 2-like n=1 Tax=Salmo trutta TaxID=8032 RepID=UPI0011324B13|nr:protein Hook homolog 2-like [Salmo trutta]XP_029629987.1 protein Hook homolog 2-like [Salmo trutta]XP_029629988.1 protein Hook homolog 2-like [Salmo trutta]XP_029629989.1 protein Hook homolog 2-like [Salmo trutta]